MSEGVYEVARSATGTTVLETQHAPHITRAVALVRSHEFPLHVHSARANAATYPTVSFQRHGFEEMATAKQPITASQIIIYWPLSSMSSGNVNRSLWKTHVHKPEYSYRFHVSAKWDAQFTHAVPQCPRIQPQEFGSASCAFDFPTGHLEYVYEK